MEETSGGVIEAGTSEAIEAVEANSSFSKQAMKAPKKNELKSSCQVLL